MIVKMQRFLAGNDTARSWSIYDEKRKCYQHVPEAAVTRRMRALIGDKDCVFLHATFDEASKSFTLLREADPEKW